MLNLQSLSPYSYFSCALRVPFRDVDSWGMVWHGHYFSYVDHGRAELLAVQGWSIPRLSMLGFLLPIVHVDVQYRAPAYIHDELSIEVAMLQPRGSLVYTYFKIYHVTPAAENKDPVKRLCVYGCTEQVFTDKDRSLLYHVPEVVAPLFKHLDACARGDTSYEVVG